MKEIEYRRVEELTLLEDNPRKISVEQMERLKESIDKNPDYFECRPVILSDRTGELVVIAGNQRVKAATAIGLEAVPTILLSGLTEEREKEIIIRDNVNNGEWDEEMLAEWDASLLDDWGVDISALSEKDFLQVGEENREAKEDDFDEGKDAIPALVTFGDIWKLAEHRLMCGDSTDAGSVALLMNGDKADMVFTDPPYNVNIIGGANRFANDEEKAKGLTILNDNFSSDEEAGEKLWYPAFLNMRENANDRCAIYVTMPQGGTHMMMMMMIAKAGWQVKHELIWKKQSLVLGRQDYNYQHEPICYGWNKTHNFVGGGKYATTSVWEFDRPTKSKEHPTMKPLELIGECLLDNSREGEIVLDVFGGSGSTMMACEQLGRKCYMMELAPHYCDVIIARWEKLTGKKAEKVS